MIKKIFYLIILIFVFACDSESTGDCFQKTGTIIQGEIALSSFDKILVNRDVELIIKEGVVQKVVIETGKNLFNDVEAKVIDGTLILTDNNTCNYVRDYGVTKVYVTSPNITEIRSSTQYDVSSDGVLNYSSLSIFSEDFSAPGSFTVGDFKLQIVNTSFQVLFNNISNCYVTGTTDNLFIGFYAGTSRFEGRNLVAQNVQFYSRSSNDIIINPRVQLKGTIVSTGDVISVNMPPIVEVEELYKGRLIFE